MRARLRGSDQRGQAAVETALTMPMMLFALLGILQVTLAYHARILAEYAAFKTVRAGSVYRADCSRMQRAALTALIPSMGGGGKKNLDATGSVDPQSQFLDTARRILGSSFNRSPKGNPLVFVDYRIDHLRRPFDLPLEPGDEVMTLRVRLAYFFEYRIPVVNWIIVKYWLAVQRGLVWAESDPLLPMTPADQPARDSSGDAELVAVALAAANKGYYTAPIVSSWSMRMMSDPMPSEKGSGRCR